MLTVTTTLPDRAGLKVNYKFGSWKPFAEIWSSDISSSSKDREAKYRVGIAYSF